jgi:hypothetical protein
VHGAALSVDAARLGIVVHRPLERRARSLPDLLDGDDLAGDLAVGLAAPELIEVASRNFATIYRTPGPSPPAATREARSSWWTGRRAG